MAKYLHNDQGEIDAVLKEDGEWQITLPDGKKLLASKAVFVTQYRQVFPRAVEGDCGWEPKFFEGVG